MVLYRYFLGQIIYKISGIYGILAILRENRTLNAISQNAKFNGCTSPL